LTGGRSFLLVNVGYRSFGETKKVLLCPAHLRTYYQINSMKGKKNELCLGMRLDWMKRISKSLRAKWNVELRKHNTKGPHEQNLTYIAMHCLMLGA
jgi:hypothetical protein